MLKSSVLELATSERQQQKRKCKGCITFDHADAWTYIGTMRATAAKARVVAVKARCLSACICVNWSEILRKGACLSPPAIWRLQRVQQKPKKKKKGKGKR